MSRPALKLLHYAATRALLAAEVFGLLAGATAGVSETYTTQFWSDVAAAWAQLVPSTHHDFVNGTASDPVYVGEQLPWLTAANATAAAVRTSALSALAANIGYQSQAGETAVLLANPAGVPFDGVVELAGPIPLATHGVRTGSSTRAVQPTYAGGLAFETGPVPSMGYTTVYLTAESGHAVAGRRVVEFR